MLLLHYKPFIYRLNALYGLLTGCGYRCIIALYSYVQLCFICVLIDNRRISYVYGAVYPGSAVICRGYPGINPLGLYKLYCDIPVQRRICHFKTF